MSEHNQERAAIVLAAGSGQRLNAGINKSWLQIAGKELAVWSLIWLQKSNLFKRFILVVHENEINEAQKIIKKHLDFTVEIIAGGSTRHGSETAALKYLAQDINLKKINLVLIHDGARPLATPDLIHEIVEAAEIYGGSLPYLPTAKLISDSENVENLIRVQTPQVFRAKETLDAYLEAEKDGFIGSDTAMCLEKYQPRLEIKAVFGTIKNIKVTYPDDIQLAESMLKETLKI
jgi:2-C-methyl-D-erythritol 4-phosphate cytidylyltransferase